jgi:hypothetical protein
MRTHSHLPVLLRLYVYSFRSSCFWYNKYTSLTRFELTCVFNHHFICGNCDVIQYCSSLHVLEGAYRGRILSFVFFDSINIWESLLQH